MLMQCSYPTEEPSPTKPLALPPLNLPETLHNVSRYHTDYFRCNDGESASIVKTCMERDWCGVVQARQLGGESQDAR